MTKAKKNKTIATEEFSAKYKLGLTLSPIDVCLKKELISKAMHASANYFVYLYSIRFGCSHLRSQTSEVYNHDRWRNRSMDKDLEEKQNALYKELMMVLKKLNCYEMILDICVYDKFPSFLKQIKCATSDVNLIKFKRALEEITIILRNLS